jgi:hypothetical protein
MASAKSISDELKKLLDASSLPDISNQLTELKVSMDNFVGPISSAIGEQ